MAEPDIAPEPLQVAQPPGQRSLPFTFAQQQGVLLMDSINRALMSHKIHDIITNL